jgi:hypothetical protein
LWLTDVPGNVMGKLPAGKEEGMAELEQAAVSAINLDPDGHIRLLEPNLDADLKYQRWLPTQMIAFPGEPDRRCDTVAELASQAQTQPPWAYVLEVEARARSRFPDRLFEYQARAARRLRHGPRNRDCYLIACGAIVLTGRLPPVRLKMRLPGTKLGLSWRARIFNMSTRSAMKTLERIASGQLSRAILAWIPLMRGGGSAEVVKRWLEVCGDEPDEQRRMDYANLARVFAERAGCLDVWKKALEGWQMWKSKVIQEWRDDGRVQGRVEGQRDLLVKMVKLKYPNLPGELLTRIEKSDDPAALEAWSAALLTRPDQAAFEAALGTANGNAAG